MELLQGKNLVLFFRERAKHLEEDGSKLRFQTEHSLSMSKDSEGTLTKDGMMNSISDGETTLDVTSLAYVDDQTTLETWKILKDCFLRKALMEVWEVDTTNVTGENLQVEATYYQGYFTSFEISAPAEGNVELSYSFVINGNGAEGIDVLTEEQLSAIQSAVYEYESIQKATP